MEGGSGPSGMDAEEWRRVICSNDAETIDLRNALAEMINSCIDEITTIPNGTKRLFLKVKCYTSGSW